MGLRFSHAPTAPSPSFYPLSCFSSESPPRAVPFIRPRRISGVIPSPRPVTRSSPADSPLICNSMRPRTRRASPVGLASYDLLVFFMSRRRYGGNSLAVNAPRCWEVNPNLIQAVLDDGSKAALQRYVDFGGNFVAFGLPTKHDVLRQGSW
jgi:hypothetical protein